MKRYVFYRKAIVVLGVHTAQVTESKYSRRPQILEDIVVLVGWTGSGHFNARLLDAGLDCEDREFEADMGFGGEVMNYLLETALVFGSGSARRAAEVLG